MREKLSIVMNGMNKKNNPKIFLLGLISLIFLIIIILGIFKYFQIKLPYEKVIFSNTKYPKEQKKVIELLQEGYSSEFFSSQNVSYEQKNRMTVYPEDLYISRIDLNNDKILDVIAFTNAGGFNGTLGGCTTFWIINKNGQWEKILDVICYNLIIVFNKTHNSFRDIGFMYFDNIGETKAGRSIWIWDGKNYDYLGLFSLEEQDWEVFKDEIIQ